MKNKSLLQDASISTCIGAFFRGFALILFIGIVAVLAFIEPANAANLTWDAGNTANGATIDPASGTWDTTSTFWNNGSSDVAWTSANVAQFGGADGSYAITVGTAISAQNLVFLNSGYVLSAGSAQTVTSTATGSGAAPNVQVASGKTGSISNNVTVNITSSTCVFGSVVGNAGTRTLIIDNGGALKHTGNGSFIQVGNATVKVKTGGFLLAASTAGTAVTIGGGTAGTDLPVLSVEGGTFSNTVTGGPLSIGNANSGTLTITNGGLVAMAQNVSKPLQIGGSVASAGKTGTVNLDGGTLIVNQVTNQTAGNTSVFNFNGGTLIPNNSANTATFMNGGLTTANVRNGGAVLDNAGFAVTITQPLLHSSIGGDNITDGGLVSQGTGTNTLTGANSYNGPTVVKAGTLFTTSASTGAGAYSVSNNATLNVQVSSSGGQLAMSSLTEGTSGADVLTNAFTLGSFPSTTTAAVGVSGALTLNGTVTVNVTGSSLSGPNTYLLMSYGFISGSGSFVAGSLPSVNGFIVSITNDTTAKKLELVYTAAPAPVQWAVGDGNWDTTTANWVPLGGGSATTYTEGALLASFDDSASGTSPLTVILAANRTPGIVTNNSTKNYIFAGNFSINSPQLIKDGSSTMTLDNGSGNTFASVLIKNGTLQVGNGDTGGSLGLSGVTNNGSLAFSRTDSLTFANLISGTGGVTQSGSGTVTLSGADTYTGNTVINAGKLTTTTASIGAGNYTVADNATLEVQVAAAGKSLTNSSLTLGTSGSLTTVFTLGANASTTVPAIIDNGALALNGTVTVNVTGTGLATGTYFLLSYGSISGSGSFVLASAPSLNGNAVTLVNDTTAKQLKLVYTAVTSMTWDSGNTANGATIDAGNGTWNMTLDNVVWNDGGVNRPWVNAVDATFGGVDGTWAISLATNVSPKTIAFTNDGYVISAAAAQTVTLTTSGSGASPNLKISTGKTAVIGGNVTVQASGANNLIIGGPSGTGNPAGTLKIDNGGIVQMAGNSSLGLVGVGATLNVMTGGVLGRTTTGTVLLGSLAGDNCILNVNGGSVALTGNGVIHIGGNGTAAALGGTLNMNAGTFNMDAGNTTQPMMLGVLAGNLGTNNLNGGIESVNQIVQGAGSGYINFNGGTLKAVNGAFGSTFMNGLTAANVLGGGAVVDNNGFSLTIGQALLNGVGTDGGLTSLGAGSLTLTGVNTYNGSTIINAGRLALSGSGSIANSSNIVVASGAIFDVSASAFALGSSQTLSNCTSTATLNGNVDASVGTISLTYASGTPSFVVTNGTLTLSGLTTFKVNNIGSALTAGNYKLVATNTDGLVAGVLPSAIVGGSGLAAGTTASLQIMNGGLYLTVSVSTPPTPQITSISLSGTTLTITATNGAANGTYVLLQSTNVALPLAQWTPALTNNFDGSGNLNLSTNIVDPNITQQFYILFQ